MIVEIVQIFQQKEVYDKLPCSQIIRIVYHNVYFPSIEKLKVLSFALANAIKKDNI